MSDRLSQGPTFIIAGAARSGTTSLYRWLRTHSEVFMPAVKETNYFSQFVAPFHGPGDEDAREPLERDKAGRPRPRGAAYIVSRKEYLSLFVEGEHARARGEASPSYLYSREAAVRI